MMYQGIDHLAGIGVPHSDSAVRRAGYNCFVVVLQAQDRTRVSRQHLYALQGVSVPYLYSVVPETGNDFLIVVLQTVDSFRIFAATIYSLQIVPSHSPIVVYAVDVLDDLREESSVECVIRMILSRSRFK